MASHLVCYTKRRPGQENPKYFIMMYYYYDHLKPDMIGNCITKFIIPSVDYPSNIEGFIL